MSNDTKLRACLVGAGHIGRFHTRHLSQHESWTCSGIFDTDGARADQVGQEFSVPVAQDFEFLLQNSDAVFITCPTAYHFQYAQQALKAGKHVFIEKPITQTIEEAEQLVTLAEQGGLKIQVGHVERFNPALLALNGIDLNPGFIEAHRLVGFVPRGMDNPVVHENMIHDIDIILSLVKSPVKSIQANGVAVVSKRPDIANARITFENGCVANVTASRISLNPMRKMRIFQPEHYITIDFQKGSTELYRLTDDASQADGDQVIPMEGSDKILIYSNKELPKQDAMHAEQTAFAQCISENSIPVVSGQDGLEALRIAEQINQQLLDQQ
ncbi:MAG: Gfo/Idh/MocA family oxidoreductase [Candidatus Marinimicrobia bacterium]|nr:Gfo/Idh/MocA family oxidoreductase [Candidatus Neomarinimicrobiota bacterium]MCF7903770.1 Gfo/Idh/MocA family oxidoreductase [Candidatus Neomarinimicrobiota bacterium]